MYRVLVIDDQDLITDLLKQALTRFGYHVSTASEGREGLVLYENEPFDLVITDLVMADMDGHSVARHIRNSARPRTPIIGMSGTPWLLKKNGFDRVLAKPFSLKHLLSTVTALLDGKPGRLGSPTPYHPRALGA